MHCCGVVYHAGNLHLILVALQLVHRGLNGLRHFDFTGAFGTEHLQRYHLLAVEQRPCALLRHRVLHLCHIAQTYTATCG